MTPQPDKEQAVREIYLLLRRAAAGRQPVAAVYDGLPRLLCPHVLGRKAGRLTRSSISLEEAATAAYQWHQMEWAPGAASPWRNSAKSSCAPTHGTPNHVPRGKLVLMKSISTWTLSRTKIRNKGSEGVAAATGAPRRYAASRSSADYGARGGPGDPRGRKSDAGPRVANPR